MMIPQLREKVHTELRRATSPKEPAGVCDYRGLAIHSGDIIEFGVTDGKVVQYGRAYETKCTDVVLHLDGEWYAYCIEVNGCSRLSTVAAQCKVLGNVNDESDLVLLDSSLNRLAVAILTSRIFDK